jgi:hypothetical protein
MTIREQNFDTYTGDAIFPQVTITKRDGSVMDLSTVQEIIWNIKDQKGVVKLEKLKSTGGVSLPTGGADGVMQINIATGETEFLAGRFAQQVMVFDGSNQQNTVMTGVVNVLTH